jgi:hypothetical protein
MEQSIDPVATPFRARQGPRPDRVVSLFGTASRLSPGETQ